MLNVPVKVLNQGLQQSQSAYLQVLSMVNNYDSKKMGHEHPQGEAGDLLITIRLDAEEGRRWEGGRLIQGSPCYLLYFDVGRRS